MKKPKTTMFAILLWIVSLCYLIGCENPAPKFDWSGFERVYVETHENDDGSIPDGTMRVIEVTLTHADSGGPCCVTQLPDGSKMYFHGTPASLEGLHVGMIIDDDVLPRPAR